MLTTAWPLFGLQDVKYGERGRANGCKQILRSLEGFESLRRGLTNGVLGVSDGGARLDCGKEYVDVLVGSARYRGRLRDSMALCDKSGGEGGSTTGLDCYDPGLERE